MVKRRTRTITPYEQYIKNETANFSTPSQQRKYLRTLYHESPLSNKRRITKVTLYYFPHFSTSSKARTFLARKYKKWVNPRNKTIQEKRSALLAKVTSFKRQTHKTKYLRQIYQTATHCDKTMIIKIVPNFFPHLDNTTKARQFLTRKYK